MKPFDPPEPQGASYYPHVRLASACDVPPSLAARLLALGARRYLEVDEGHDRPHRIAEAFGEVLDILADTDEAALVHRRQVWLARIMALSSRYYIEKYRSSDPRFPGLLNEITTWLDSGTPLQGPTGEELFPLMGSANQGLDEAVDVYRCLSEMPNNPGQSAQLLLDILDWTLDGFAIRPCYDGARDLFHWWLSEAVPAAYMLQLPDHIWNGYWPWPPRPAEDQSPSVKNT